MNWYDFGARNYDPSLGMWFNVDPLAEAGVTNTPYNYCVNNPVNYTDPNGMKEQAYWHGREGRWINPGWLGKEGVNDSGIRGPRGGGVGAPFETDTEGSLSVASDEDEEVLIWDMDWGVDINAVEGGLVDSWAEMADLLIKVAEDCGKEISGFIYKDEKTGDTKYWIHPWVNNTNRTADYYLEPIFDASYKLSKTVHSHTSLDKDYPEYPSIDDYAYMIQTQVNMIVIGHDDYYIIEYGKQYEMKRETGTYNGVDWATTRVYIEPAGETNDIYELGY